MMVLALWVSSQTAEQIEDVTFRLLLTEGTGRTGAARSSSIERNGKSEVIQSRPERAFPTEGVINDGAFGVDHQGRPPFR